MANRSVFVDDATWNNRHLGTIAHALVTPESAAYPIRQSFQASDDMKKLGWFVRNGHETFPRDVPSEENYTRQGERLISRTLDPRHCMSLLRLNFGQPPGYDRARKARVGVKDIELTPVEEAFTSEHWLVRIYKVKQPGNIQQLQRTRPSVEKAAPRLNTADFLGCVTGESILSKDRVYSGGRTGAHNNLALQHAIRSKKKYFAIARVRNEGHAFAFDPLLVSKDEYDGNDAGCHRPCIDFQSNFCGCADRCCTEVDTSPGHGQEHNRRWAIYHIQV